MMKRIILTVTILVSAFMLSACEHYFPYGNGYFDDEYSDRDGGYYGGHGGGYYGGGGHEGGGEHDD